MENNWLDRGEGGEWYESYINNRDLIQIGTLTIFACVMIILLITLI